MGLRSNNTIATETANVILLANNLLEFVTAIKIAERVDRTIKVNSVGTTPSTECASFSPVLGS